MRRLAYAMVFCAVLLTGFGAGVLAQKSPGLTPLSPFLVDIQQTVPVTFTFTIDDGQTVTVPASVGVFLMVQVNAAGDVSPTMQVGKAVAPVVAVTPLTLAPAEGSVVVGGVRWAVQSAEDVGQSFDYGRGEDYQTTTEGRFIHVVLRIDNEGDSPVYFNMYDWAFSLIDAQGRTYKELNYEYSLDDQCDHNDLNPGLGKSCVAVFEVPATAAGLVLSIQLEEEHGELPLSLSQE